MAVYYASKAYVLSFSEALSSELRRTASPSPRCVPARFPPAFGDRAGFSNKMDWVKFASMPSPAGGGGRL